MQMYLNLLSWRGGGHQYRLKHEMHYVLFQAAYY